MVIELNARSLDRAFTYSVPASLRASLRVGSYVRVPFGKQMVCGFVVGLTDAEPAFATRPVVGKAVDEDPLDEDQVALGHWLSVHFRCSLADALRCFLPPGAARKPERHVRLTEKGQAADAENAAGSAPNQLAVLQALRAQSGESGAAFAALAALFGKSKEAYARAGGAVRALEEKGLVEDARRLSHPAAAPLVRQVAALVEDCERDWLALVDELTARAPRQAEVIAALLEADGEPVAVADLPRDAAKALAKAGLVEIRNERQERTPEGSFQHDATVEFLALNPAQQAVLDQVQTALAEGQARSFLIHGVTGSGKTEVYLHSIDAAVRAGRSAIVLVPEISLTPQAVGRFRARFGGRLALLHSALSAGERFDEWDRIRRGEADIIVGARSAIFAPCKRLGVIVVDEEHDKAYKQDSEPRYSAQAVAAERARRDGAVLLLGSATPSVEAYFGATQGTTQTGACPGLELVELPERIDSRPMPPVEIVDLRRELIDARHGLFSETLLEAMRERIAAGEQTILFLNRRGFSTFVMCRECGVSLRCPNCAVSLTYHHKTRRMQCHHCDHDQAVPDQCGNCEGYDVGFHGSGTERVEDQLGRHVEGAVVLRMDRDTTARRNAYSDILGRFGRGEANVLIGTQMVAKGHHFPNVTLVGVLNADTGLNRPDFRAAESTFQVLTQVSGRAGRDDKPGRVIIQTYNPDHYAILAAAEHDYGAFYRQELAHRRTNRYPPFASLVKLGLSDENEEAALGVGRRIAVILQELGVSHGQGGLQYLGPAEAPLHKLRGRYRYHILLKAPTRQEPVAILDALLSRLGDTGETSVTVDVDPMDMM